MPAVSQGAKGGEDGAGASARAGASSEGGSGGVGASASVGGTGVVPSGGSAEAGSAPVGSEGGGAGESPGQGGSGGAVTPVCAAPHDYSVSTTLDLWIGSADEGANHGGDDVLYVSGGSDERRALFAITLPAAPAGAVLLSAAILLDLESNADASQVARQLVLRLVAPRAVREDKANWTHFAQGNNRWDTPGGDLGEPVSEAEVPAGTSSGQVRFDVTEAVRGALTSSSSLRGIAVLETGQAPSPPAELAFTSREGNASGSPRLSLRYCQP